MNTTTSRNVKFYLGVILPRTLLYSMLGALCLSGSPLSILVLAAVIVADIKTRGAL